MTTHAEQFHRLHAGPELLILANAWDAASARVIESLGARAIATTSAGVAWTHGYPDGDALPLDALVASVRAIARVIRVPLSVDFEGGYSQDPAIVADKIAAIIDAGAVGINLEDAAGGAELLARKITAVKSAAARRGVNLFVNARTDVYLRALAPEADRVAETLARAARYRDAGADGIFVPRAIAPDEIRALVAGVGLPLNLLATPRLPPAAELTALGVRRLSAGSGLAQGAWGRTVATTQAFLADGRSEPLAEGVLPYAELNALFTAR